MKLCSLGVNPSSKGPRRSPCWKELEESKIVILVDRDENVALCRRYMDVGRH